MLLLARNGPASGARPIRRPSPLGIDAGTWLLILLTILAAVLRFVMLDHQSFWLDEAQAAHELRLPVGQMFSAWSSYEWNPPLYLIVAWPWAKLFGTGDVALRSLSALLGVALVPLLYLCGRELISRRAGFMAAALAAVNPFMIWYSQEAREYMLLVVLCAASLLFFVRAWHSPDRRHIVWWGVLAALALLTQYYAGFLIAAEGLALVVRWRSRASVIALLALGVLELALVPHVLPRLDHPVQFIAAIPLATRIQQVPVSFGMSTLYESNLVSYGLIGAAVLAGAVIVLLIVGADGAELRGAGIAAGLAAFVLLVPLVMALFGHDDYLARGLMPAWVPLVILLAAACTARGARLGGAVLAAVLFAMFIYALVRIDTEPQFQKPDWRGVAEALGRPHGERAIVAYDGIFATAPLSHYLPGVPWSGPGLKPLSPAPVRVSEVDVVGSASQSLAALPAGVHVISSRVVDGYRVVRFGLAPAWTLGPSVIGARAGRLLGPGAAAPMVVFQPPRQSS